MLIFAHRGASSEAPENTLEAFQIAIERGVDGIEIDVHAVEDELYVIHDRWLHRTTSGSGRVKDQSKAIMALLDAGNGQVVPTLWQTLQCINGACVLNIELKGISDVLPVLQHIDRAVNELDFRLEQFILSSFNHHLLFKVKQLRPSIQIGALTASCPLDYAAFAQQLNAYSVHIDIDCLSADFVFDAHQRGLPVYVYTVDEIEDLDDMAAMGVNGVFTNVPSRALVRRAHHLQTAEAQPSPLSYSSQS